MFTTYVIVCESKREPYVVCEAQAGKWQYRLYRGGVIVDSANEEALKEIADWVSNRPFNIYPFEWR